MNVRIVLSKLSICGKVEEKDLVFTYLKHQARARGLKVKLGQMWTVEHSKGFNAKRRQRCKTRYCCGLVPLGSILQYRIDDVKLANSCLSIDRQVNKVMGNGRQISSGRGGQCTKYYGKRGGTCITQNCNTECKLNCSNQRTPVYHRSSMQCFTQFIFNSTIKPFHLAISAIIVRGIAYCLDITCLPTNLEFSTKLGAIANTKVERSTKNSNFVILQEAASGGKTAIKKVVKYHVLGESANSYYQVACRSHRGKKICDKVYRPLKFGS